MYVDDDEGEHRKHADDADGLHNACLEGNG